MNSKLHAEGGSDSRRTNHHGSDNIARPATAIFQPGDSTACSCYVLIPRMSDRPASWRMPTPKQMKEMAAAAAAVGRNVPSTRLVGPNDDIPAEYWDALLRDACFDVGPG